MFPSNGLVNIQSLCPKNRSSLIYLANKICRLPAKVYFKRSLENYTEE